jgi:hypothetical protein
MTLRVSSSNLDNMGAACATLDASAAHPGTQKGLSLHKHGMCIGALFRSILDAYKAI